MRTRRSNYPNNSNVTIPRRRRKQVSNIVEPEIRTIVEMAERTMEELLRDLRMGAGETIVYQKKSMLITLEIKTNLLQLVQRSFSVVEREKSSCSILLVSKGLPRLYDLASTLGTLPSNTIPNPKGEMKAITTRSGVAYEGPSIPTNPSPKKTLPKTTPILESDIPKSLPKPNIPYPSRCDDQKSRDKASNQMEKIFQIFQDLHFYISFADALLLMPRFASTIKSLLMNKEKLLELAKISLNENCSTMLLKKLPEKLRDPGKFLIPCNFSGMDVCHALANLSASINLMPLSIWKNLSLHDLTPTRMTLELADQSITYPKGLAEDVFVKVGKFHFPTLWVDNKAVTFNLDQTTRYYSTNDKSVNRIDIIDAVCEEYAPEFL
ncbi:reverse transcriptase domain-containing protein [Tanacetum coccineum]